MHGNFGPEIAETLIPLCTSCHRKVHSDTAYDGRIGMLQTELRAGDRFSSSESTGARLSLINGHWEFELTDMKTITLKIDVDTRDQLDAEADEQGYDSRSAYLREIIENRHEADEIREQYQTKIKESRERYQTRLDDLEAERDELQDQFETERAEFRERLEAREDRIEDLEGQLRERSRVEDKIEDLPDKIRATESYQERRQRLLDQASFAERVKWKLTGVPTERIDADGGAEDDI